MRPHYRSPSGRSLRRPHYQNFATSVLPRRYARARYATAARNRGGIHIDHIMAFVVAAIVMAVCGFLVIAIFAAPGERDGSDGPPPIVHTRPQTPPPPPPPPCYPFQGDC